VLFLEIRLSLGRVPLRTDLQPRHRWGNLQRSERANRGGLQAEENAVFTERVRPTERAQLFGRGLAVFWSRHRFDLLALGNVCG
jgi:hypothetical protein